MIGTNIVEENTISVLARFFHFRRDQVSEHKQPTQKLIPVRHQICDVRHAEWKFGIDVMFGS